MSSNPPLIEVKGLSKSFALPRPVLWKPAQALQVLRDIHLTIQEGEIVGLVGESGSGKSTLGECIGGLQTAPPGTIKFRGTSLEQLQGAGLKEYQRSVQYVFQDPVETLNPRYTVEQIIAEPIRTAGLIKQPKDIREAVEQLLQDVGLDAAYMKSRPAQLSGGQCQRVAIARALSTKPALLICDEAVSALDLSVQATILNLLGELRRKYRISQLFISHDLHVVKYLADRVAVIHQGTIVESGHTEHVFKHPEHAYTQSLISSAL